MQCSKEGSCTIKPTGNECCNNGFWDWKINIALNTAKVTNRIEVRATNMFSENKIVIKCNTKITYNVWRCDAMIKDVRRDETSKFVPLSGCTYNNENCFFSPLSPSLLFFIKPEISLRQSPLCLCKRKIGVCCKWRFVYLGVIYI